MTPGSKPPRAGDLNLDDPDQVRRLDSDGMLEKIRCVPEQCLLGWNTGRSVALPDGYSRVTAAVVAGVGGSAIGGDLVRAITQTTARVPVLVNRDYSLPNFVGADTLVVCSSYSGATAETLSALDEAMARKAKIVLLGTGGRLFEIGAEYPKIRIHARGMPRSAVAESALALLSLLESLELIPSFEAQVNGLPAELARVVRSLDLDVPEGQNPAKQLARRLHGRVPVIVGIGPLGPVARRWKAQINENADHWAVFDELPEFNHNSIQGVRLPPAAPESLQVIFLRPEATDLRSARQAAVAGEMLGQFGIATSTLTMPGDGPLVQLLSGVVWGDFISYYLSALNGVDPTPIANIELLKGRMAGLI